MNRPNKAFILIGVSGCGKTTIGKLVVNQLNSAIDHAAIDTTENKNSSRAIFLDADSLHSPENIKKMAQGVALNDEDRIPWLVTVRNAMQELLHNGFDVFVACSALKQSYRHILTEYLDNKPFNILFVHLRGTFESIVERFSCRNDHFFPLELLQSQFAILEDPCPASTILPDYAINDDSVIHNPLAISVDASRSPDDLASSLISNYNLCELGLFGLGVMGKSFARNLTRNGVRRLALFNRRVEGTAEVKVAENFRSEYLSELSEAECFEDVALFMSRLSTPRRIILLIEAGKVTDIVLSQLLAHSSPGDVIVDLGNSFYQDTIRRVGLARQYHVHLVGSGISGGEKGALTGAAIMASGDEDACRAVVPFLSLCSAKDGLQKHPCCGIFKGHGAGHFIKTIHNGIEYAEMQLLAELTHVMRNLGGLDNVSIADILASWETDYKGYLLEITISILKDPILDEIVDVAQGKGTGSWAACDACSRSIPASMLVTALLARSISSHKQLRLRLSELYNNEDKPLVKHPIELSKLKEAYQLARAIANAQGLWLISTASQDLGWKVNLHEVARIWTNGCILRSTLMCSLAQELKNEQNPFLLPSISTQVRSNRGNLKEFVLEALKWNISIPCFSESLGFINAISEKHGSAGLIQAQRDFFGAHTFKRFSSPDVPYHHKWPDS